jgi:hypothetical protein
LCWQFDIRLIAKLRDAIKSVASLFQIPYCTSQDVDYLTIIIWIQETKLVIISLSHQCGVHVTVYTHATVSLHAQNDVNKYLVLIVGVHCDVKLHIVQYPAVRIR